MPSLIYLFLFILFQFYCFKVDNLYFTFLYIKYYKNYRYHFYLFCNFLFLTKKNTLTSFLKNDDQYDLRLDHQLPMDLLLVFFSCNSVGNQILSLDLSLDVYSLLLLVSFLLVLVNLRSFTFPRKMADFTMDLCSSLVTQSKWSSCFWWCQWMFGST